MVISLDIYNVREKFASNPSYSGENAPRAKKKKVRRFGKCMKWQAQNYVNQTIKLLKTQEMLSI